MSDMVDSFFDEYARRYTDRDIEGVTNLCLWPFLAIRAPRAQWSALVAYGLSAGVLASRASPTSVLPLLS
jgi:hypothetical protein